MNKGGNTGRINHAATFIPARVLQCRLKNNPSELTIARSEVLLIHPSVDCQTGTPWLVASNNKGQVGLVPETHVKRITEQVLKSTERFTNHKKNTKCTRPHKRKRQSASKALSEPNQKHLTHKETSIVVPSLQLVLDLRMVMNRCDARDMFQGIFNWLQLAGKEMEHSTYLHSTLKCWLHQVVKRLSIEYFKLPAQSASHSIRSSEVDLSDQIRFVESTARIHREISLQPLTVARLLHSLVEGGRQTNDDDQRIALASLLQLSASAGSPMGPPTKSAKLNHVCCGANLSTTATDVPATNDPANPRSNTIKKPVPLHLSELLGATSKGIRPLSPNSPIHFIKI